MGHFVDFLDSLLGDNVMNDYEKIVRQMSHAEAQSKILNQDYRYRILYYNHVAKRIQSQQIRHIKNMRIKHK